MDRFSISQLAQFSGIKPHTIRAWEQRYGALQPNRSEGNTRYYKSEQLRRLLNIVSLKNSDHKISDLCRMPDEDLFELIKIRYKNTVTDSTSEYFISQLIKAGMNYDEVHFEKIFSHCLLRNGLKKTYIKIIYPMLVRMGLMWKSDNLPPAHEHFISNVIHQKLLTAIDSLPPARPDSDTWLLFLPENEFHSIGLLFANFLIRQSRNKVIFLGSNVPKETLKIAAEDTNPDHMLLFFVHYNTHEKTQKYIDQLITLFPDINLFLSGNRTLIRQIGIQKKIQWLKSVEDLEHKLNN